MTKARILDAAERLFGHHGVDATSLRAITTEAGVNLASVNYHFQSKEALVRAVLARRLAPVNRQRIETLDRYEAAAGAAPVPLELLLEAFIRPVLEMRKNCAREFVPLMGRLYSERREFAEQVFRDHFTEVANRFQAAFSRTFPDLPRPEIAWRMHFTIGSMAHSIGAAHLLLSMSRGACDTEDTEGVLARLIAFCAAGFRADVPENPHAN